MNKKQSAKNSSQSQDRLNLERQLCFALYSASRAMTGIYRPLLEPLDLTYPQYLVMMVLWQQDNLTLSELGEHLKLDSGTLTPLLKRLESTGLLRRERDANDERKVRVSLTPEGVSLRNQAQGVPGLAAATTGHELAELDDLTRRVTKLRNSIAENLES